MKQLCLGFLLVLGGLTATFADMAPVSTTAWLQTGSQQQRLGYYQAAQAAYQSALQQAKQHHDEHGQALANSALGHVAILLQHPEQATLLLAEALATAKRLKLPELVMVTEYYSGLVATDAPVKTAFLQKALAAAEQHQQPELSVRCHLALAQAAPDASAFKHHQQQALAIIKHLKQPAVAAELRLVWVEQNLDNQWLPPLNSVNGQDGQRLALLYQQLQQAKAQLPADNQRRLAQYYGLLGNLYEHQQRYREALTLTQTALAKAPPLKEDDLAVFHHWQAARLQSALQQPDAAIASYRRAIQALQTIRQDIPVTYQNGKSSFYELFGPIYRSATDLLLQRAAAKTKANDLAEARDLMELLRQTELEDFFKDRCLLTDLPRNNALPIQSAHTAVFYPVLLPDRLELLLGIGDRLIQRTINVSREELEQYVRHASNFLRGHDEDLEVSQQLYTWLLKPLEAELQANAVDSLLYVPDGFLRLLPLAALHDGQHYVLERYALTTAPSLALVPHSDRQGGHNVLLAGLSEPSTDTVRQLPPSSLAQLPSGTEIKRGLAENDLAASKPVPTLTRDSLQRLAQSLALPGVQTEIAQLSAQLSSQVMLNRDYTLHNFDQAVKHSNYGMVHIASHGYFGKSAADSFVMTYDQPLKIDHLETLLQGREAQSPLDLLVFSACQTAEGDDRAPLGLAGVVLKAKANNALGALWNMNDQAAARLMQDFYQGFTQQGLSKAKALQQAQLRLRQDKPFASPYYWAALVLVGNGE